METGAKQINDFLMFNKLLGKGQFGSVFKGESITTKKPVAIKQIAIRNLDESTVHLLLREIEAMGKIMVNVKTSPDDNLVRCFDMARTKENFYIVLEYCDGGDLEGYLKSRGGKVSEEEAKKIMKQILNGYAKLRNDMNLIHRDIKPPNILMGNGKWKIADFGFAKILGENDFTNTHKGTPYYMSPQLLGQRVLTSNKHESYSYKTDIWSLGVLYYLLLVGKLPFPANTLPDLYRLAAAGKVDFPAGDKVSSRCQELIRKMLVPAEAGRINLESLMKDPYLYEQENKVAELNNLRNTVTDDFMKSVIQGDIRMRERRNANLTANVRRKRIIEVNQSLFNEDEEVKVNHVVDVAARTEEHEALEKRNHEIDKCRNRLLVEYKKISFLNHVLLSYLLPYADELGIQRKSPLYFKMCFMVGSFSIYRAKELLQKGKNRADLTFSQLSDFWPDFVSSAASEEILRMIADDVKVIEDVVRNCVEEARNAPNAMGTELQMERIQDFKTTVDEVIAVVAQRLATGPRPGLDVMISMNYLTLIAEPLSNTFPASADNNYFVDFDGFYTRMEDAEQDLDGLYNSLIRMYKVGSRTA